MVPFAQKQMIKCASEFGCLISFQMLEDLLLACSTLKDTLKQGSQTHGPRHPYLYIDMTKYNAIWPLKLLFLVGRICLLFSAI